MEVIESELQVMDRLLDELIAKAESEAEQWIHLIKLVRYVSYYFVY